MQNHTSLFKANALSVALAASISTLFVSPASIAQPFIVLPDLSDLESGVGLPSSVPTQPLATPTLTDIPEELSSPNISVEAASEGVRVILIDPVEQSYLSVWEQTITTQLSDINIRSAVQAPITQIRIRAGRPLIEQLGRSTTESFFFNTESTNTISNFPTRSPLTEFSSLPDGNYRLLLSSRGIEDGGFVKEGRLFTFRKSGNAVTGNFDYVGSAQSACVTGTLEGNTVFGQAFTSSPRTEIMGGTYLGPGLSLRLSDSVNSDGAVLDLNGFSLVNAGSVLPPLTCQ